MNEINIMRNVADVDPSAISELRERKAVLAMQATALVGTEMFAVTNRDLHTVAADIGAAPTMTYEDLIFVNPLEDGTYVLSDDPVVAANEALFYRAHRSIEDVLAETIDAIQSGEFDAAVACVQHAGGELGSLYRQLDPKAFAAFRPYFRGINGYPGPSGLFTAAIPTIDLLTHGGRNIFDQERARLLQDIDRRLYPSHQSGQLRKLLEQEEPRLEMPAEARVALGSLLNRFRKVHTGSVRKFVPEALNAGAEGSGGVADVASYLSSKMLHVEGVGND